MYDGVFMLLDTCNIIETDYHTDAGPERKQFDAYMPRCYDLSSFPDAGGDGDRSVGPEVQFHGPLSSPTHDDLHASRGKGRR